MPFCWEFRNPEVFAWTSLWLPLLRFLELHRVATNIIGTIDPLEEDVDSRSQQYVTASVPGSGEDAQERIHRFVRGVLTPISESEGTLHNYRCVKTGLTRNDKYTEWIFCCLLRVRILQANLKTHQYGSSALAGRWIWSLHSTMMMRRYVPTKFSENHLSSV